jgi:Rrf2 family nitric oxide-sensitive transcriptional repressor
MQITKYTDYSLRVLMLLAVQDDDRLLGIAEISETFQISRNHLGSIYIPDS